MSKSVLQLSNQYFGPADDDLIRTPKASWKLTDWIVRNSILTGTSKLVAATVASYYNKKAGFSRISYPKLQAATGLSEDTIRRSVIDMKLSGEWVVYHLKTDVHRTYKRYVPLAPLESLPGEFLDLRSLGLELEKRNEAKRSSVPVRYAHDFYRIWESHWGVLFFKHACEIMSPANDTRMGLKKLLTDEEKSFLDEVNTRVSANSTSLEEAFTVYYRDAFRYLRGYDFSKRKTNNSGLQWNSFPGDKKGARDFAIKIYNFWVEDHWLKSLGPNHPMLAGATF